MRGGILIVFVGTIVWVFNQDEPKILPKKSYLKEGLEKSLTQCFGYSKTMYLLSFSPENVAIQVNLNCEDDASLKENT